MKAALIHDWLTGMRGGEKCLEILCEFCSVGLSVPYFISSRDRPKMGKTVGTHRPHPSGNTASSSANAM
jgi:hypothetical protein